MLALVVLYSLGPPPRRRPDDRTDAGRAGRRTRRPIAPELKQVIAPGLRADRPRMQSELAQAAGEGEGRQPDA